MFKHLFINRFKVILKNKELLFWTLIFPLALGTFFYMAFSRLDEDEKFNAFDIAIINNEEYNSSELKKVIDNTDELFKVILVDNVNSANELLDEDKIVGYYYLNEEIKVIVKNSSTNATIMKSFIDSYNQTISVIGNIYEFDYTKVSDDLISKINSNYEYFKDTSNKNVDFTVLYFYTLIGMACLYGGMFGINAILDCEANLSKRGARFVVSPTNKFVSLLVNLLVSFIIQYIEILILLAFLIFVLGINFGNQVPYLLILSLLGSLAGLSLGMFVGVSNKKSYDTKIAILNAVSLSCSFLAGMMIGDLKYVIEKNLPILNRINPVALITDGLYSLYYYNDLTLYTRSMICLFIFSVVLILAAFVFLRRKKYDSI